MKKGKKSMGFGLLEELQNLGYRPVKKCAVFTMRPRLVSTDEFAEMSGLTRKFVQALCTQKKLPCLMIGTESRHKFLIDWELAYERLREFADNGIALPCVVEKGKPVTLDSIQRTRRQYVRRKSVDYRKLPQDVLEKKKALKA